MVVPFFIGLAIVILLKIVIIKFGTIKLFFGAVLVAAIPIVALHLSWTQLRMRSVEIATISEIDLNNRFKNYVLTNPVKVIEQDYRNYEEIVSKGRGKWLRNTNKKYKSFRTYISRVDTNAYDADHIWLVKNYLVRNDIHQSYDIEEEVYAETQNDYNRLLKQHKIYLKYIPAQFGQFAKAVCNFGYCDRKQQHIYEVSDHIKKQNHTFSLILGIAMLLIPLIPGYVKERDN